MKDLDILQQSAAEETDRKTGAEAKPLPKSPRGRPRGSKNKFSASSREVLEEWGAKITEAACRWAVGKPIVRINSKGQREKVYPSGDQMQTSQKLVLERLVAVRRHTELTGADGKDLITHTDPPEPRELARSVLAIFESARLTEPVAEPTPPPQPEQLLIGRDRVIELQANSDQPSSTAAAALPGGVSGVTGSGSPPLSNGSTNNSPRASGELSEKAIVPGHEGAASSPQSDYAAPVMRCEQREDFFGRRHTPPRVIRKMPK